MSLITPKQIDGLNKFLLRQKENLKIIRREIWKYTERDYQCFLIIILLALLLRLPFISHPNHSEFDEFTYVNFTLHTLHGEPFFDIHPPLARIIFTEVTRMNETLRMHSMFIKIKPNFTDFPYTALRYFNAFIGIILVFIVYCIGRILKYKPREALLPALLIIFDSALVVYSRAILPDTLLLVFNFTALALALAAVHSNRKNIFFWFLVLSGISMGLALSVKWTALAVLITLVFNFLIFRRYIAIVIIIAVTAFTYVAIFMGYFFLYFPHGGVVVYSEPYINQPWIQEIVFPETKSVKNIISFLPKYHEAMLRGSQDPIFFTQNLPAPSPITWPLAKSSIYFWINEANQPHGQRTQYILLIGNPTSWSLSLFALLFDVGWIIAVYLRSRKMPIDKDEMILLFGFAANYIPFFFIHRPMYLYHYFVALIFLFLLIPKVLPRIVHCLVLFSKDRMFVLSFMYVALFMIVANFILLMPSTYGF